MKAIFGVLSLVIVLAMIGSIAKKQLRHSGVASAAAARGRRASRGSTPQRGGGDGAAGDPAACRATVAADPNAATGAATIEEAPAAARANARGALQQGAERNQRADP